MEALFDFFETIWLPVALLGIGFSLGKIINMLNKSQKDREKSNELIDKVFDTIAKMHDSEDYKEGCKEGERIFQNLKNEVNNEKE